jgi:hypothetical protein
MQTSSTSLAHVRVPENAGAHKALSEVVAVERDAW